MTKVEHVLIVGAGIGGVRTAEQLRAAGYTGRISLVGAEQHPPYDRPPLSKQILTGEWEPERAVLRDVSGLEDLGVRAYLGTPAVALHHDAVELADGATLHGDAIVIATGVTARVLPGQPQRPPVHTLRTLDDALALRSALDASRSLLIIGAGFIGAEVATAAVAKDISVTMLEAQPVPLSRALGSEVGAMGGRLLTEAGIDVRTGVQLNRFVETDSGVGVELADGTQITADTIVVGIGARPTLDWLDGSGHGSSDELVCDERGRVRGMPGVWAVGDVAAWQDPVRGGPFRCEHWTNACDQAKVVARDILGSGDPEPFVPYVWSDQFGLKIQLFGRPDIADAVEALHGDGLSGGPVKGTVAGYLKDGRLVAVAGFGAARLLVRYRALVARQADWAEAKALAAELN